MQRLLVEWRSEHNQKVGYGHGTKHANRRAHGRRLLICHDIHMMAWSIWKIGILELPSSSAPPKRVAWLLIAELLEIVSLITVYFSVPS